MFVTPAQLVQSLKRQQRRRSDTAFAASLGISTTYWILIKRRLREPGPKVLTALGLKKVYVRNGKSARNGNGHVG